MLAHVKHARRHVPKSVFSKSLDGVPFRVGGELPLSDVR